MLDFAATIFIGAFLLFQVQPLIGKYILPWFGGGPGVWTTCMVFFQVLLLCGYGYAHLLSTWLRPRAQAVVHLVLLVVALVTLPIIPSDSWKPVSGAVNPTLQILALLTASLGVPFFVLSSTGPLMQRWFSQSYPGTSPYRLYALSNAGSLLALVSYPFLIEPHLTRAVQARLWGWGLAAFAVCCGYCAIKLVRSTAKGSGVSLAEQGPKESAHPLTFSDASFSLTRGLLWLALPACASVLLLATTNKLCQDVAVIPFLWVLPLGLYLLSFIICFDSPRWYSRSPFAVALAAALGAMCWALLKGRAASLFLLVPIYCGGLFICCMICHGELYRLKPAPARLTLFYLMIAAGGALGGVFVALVAPIAFNDYYEVQFGLILCGLLFLICCRESWQGENANDLSHPAAPVAAAGGAPLTKTRKALFMHFGWHWLGCIGLIALAVIFWRQERNGRTNVVTRSRNFYGVLTVYELGKESPQAHEFQLLHGATLHGRQFANPLLSLRRTAYYSERAGAGLALRSFPAGSRRIGVVGLGVGTLASYAQSGDYFRIYEINPQVQEIARSRFSYLSDCPAPIEIILGDARLSMEAESPQNFDVLVLDAFSSDAIPVHLLTKEAFMVYERHLKTNGVMAIHVTNTTLDLEPVVLQLAHRFNYFSARIVCATTKFGTLPSIWMLLSHSAEKIQSPSIQQAAQASQKNWNRVPLWTDDLTSLFPILGAPRPPPEQPDPAEEHETAASKLYEQGDHAGALARYRLALQTEPDLPDTLNNMAWLLASTPNDALRNGGEAVLAGEKACALTRYRVPLFIGTLGVAYAEAGRFEDAVSAAEKTCALALKTGEQEVARKNQQLRELYRAHKTYRQATK